MRSVSLCLCLLSLILAAGQAGAIDQEFPPYEDMISSSFSQSFVDSLFGIDAASRDLDGQWFGPAFQNSTSAYSFLSEFYINTSIPVASGLIPTKIDVSHSLPAKIYFGSGQEILYTQYQTAISAARGNELWIMKYQDWSQYAIVPLGAGLQFVAFAPAGGQADYYEIFQTAAPNITSRKVNLFAGYTSLSFPADRIGRHILFYVLNNQPSNAIIIDVINPPQATPAVQMPAASDMPPAFGQMSTISGGAVQTTTSYSQTTATSATGPTVAAIPPAQVATSGDTPVTIRSQAMRSYQVYLDGTLIGTEGTGGDAPDGQFSFSVIGDMSHDIRVFDGQFNYNKGMIYFQRGVLKIINVEPGTAVYI